jgi:hypothetical protein
MGMWSVAEVVGQIETGWFVDHIKVACERRGVPPPDIRETRLPPLPRGKERSSALADNGM